MVPFTISKGSLYAMLYTKLNIHFAVGMVSKYQLNLSVRISALKSYCMMLCMLLCMTLCMTYVVINKISLLLSKITVTWIFGHYHIVYEMHSMWFMWFSHRIYRLQVLCKLIILVRSRWWNWAFHLRRL